jgi:hypothetical protein
MKFVFLILILFYSSSSKAQVNRYDIIIDEIMADPNPVVQLPNAEYVELKNRSTHSINLSGFKLISLTTISSPFPSFIIKPDSFIVVTSATNQSLFAKYGNSIGLSTFPAIVNAGTTLSLLSPNGSTIHAVSYSNQWYDNVGKASGGWSLEMVDCNSPCSGRTNWKASVDAKGGTPGHVNSVDALNPDQTPPKLVRSYALDNLTLVAIFDQTLDSSSASIANHFFLTGSVTILSAECHPPLFNSVTLKLSAPVLPKTIYQLTAKQLTDCNGNEIGVFNNCKTGLTEEAIIGDIRINEILFNPRPQAYDYVEILNASNKIIDASKLYLANRDANNKIASAKKLADTTFLIFPGDYYVITENKLSIQKEYFVKNPDAIIELTTLPSFPDDKGDVVITNTTGDVIDEINYDADWQFPLISNPEGVALERIDPLQKTQDKDNWHSASTTSGYGTPTYVNSQYKELRSVKGDLMFSGIAFTPDNDGINDFLTINYQMDEAGYMANVYIFDPLGRMVRYLVKNNLLGLNGSFRWDGLDSTGKSLAQGPYVILTEIFDLQGKKRQWKNVVSIVRK